MMTFSIEKRISTELFIDRRTELYIQKRKSELSGKIEEGKCWRQDQQEVGMKNCNSSQFGMNYVWSECETITV